MAGISWTDIKKSEASAKGRAYAMVVSWEIVESGFEDAGSALAELFGGMGTWWEGGALCGELGEESGNTNVRSASSCDGCCM